MSGWSVNPGVFEGWQNAGGRGRVASDPGPAWAKRRPRDESADRRRARLVALAQLMDNRFEIPGLGVRVGLDAALGLLPGAGDAITAAVQAYIIYEGYRLGATKKQLAMMVGNVAIDTLVGLIPGVGDLFDVAFKANVRNLRIMGIDAGTPASRGR